MQEEATIWEAALLTSVLQKLYALSEGQESMILTVTQFPTPPTEAPP